MHFVTQWQHQHKVDMAAKENNNDTKRENESNIYDTGGMDPNREMNECVSKSLFWRIWCFTASSYWILHIHACIKQKALAAVTWKFVIYSGIESPHSCWPRNNIFRRWVWCHFLFLTRQKVSLFYSPLRNKFQISIIFNWSCVFALLASSWGYLITWNFFCCLNNLSRLFVYGCLPLWVHHRHRSLSAYPLSF